MTKTTLTISTLLLGGTLAALAGCSTSRPVTAQICQWTIVTTRAGVSIVSGPPTDEALLSTSVEAQVNVQRIVHCKPFLGASKGKGTTYDTARK